MIKTAKLLIVTACLAAPATLAIAPPALAQDAAESAAILSGTRGTGRVSRDAGEATRGAIGGAADAINATRQRRTSRTPTRRTNVTRRGSSQRSGGLRVTVGDALERTDAPDYQLSNGSRIRVSGTFVPATGTQCVTNCETPDEE